MDFPWKGTAIFCVSPEKKRAIYYILCYCFPLLLLLPLFLADLGSELLTNENKRLDPLLWEELLLLLATAAAEGAQKVPSFLLKVNFTCCFSVVASSITEICIVVGVLGSRHHLDLILGRILVVVNCTYLPLKLRFSFQTKVVGSWSKSKM